VLQTCRDKRTLHHHCGQVTWEVGYVEERTTDDQHVNHDTQATEEGNPDTPAGAIAVTLFLAATILVFWFGMFFLNLARSG